MVAAASSSASTVRQAEQLAGDLGEASMGRPASDSQAIGILLMWRRYHLGRPLVRRPQFGSEYNLEPELVQEG
ncbi:hypothetical protein CsatA_026650 [Cannabis sativa]